MASVEILSTGSKGNAYILEAGGQYLLLDLGIRWNDILRGVSYDIRKITAALVTHRHMDHALSVPHAVKYQIKTYSCNEVAEKYPGVIAINEKKKYAIGDFVVMPIPVPHNCENYAYIIEHSEFGRLLYATDLNGFPYRINGINHFLFEINYSNRIILDKIFENVAIRSQSQNHMELYDGIDALKRNDAKLANTIAIVHMSDGASDEEEFIREVYSETGIMPVAAAKGMEILLKKEDF